MATYMDAFQKILNTPSESRHYYEIVQENRPCNFYLDLEFQYAFNADIRKPYRIVNLLIEVIRRVIKYIYNIEIEDRDILELESSSDTKFSRHIHINL